MYVVWKILGNLGCYVDNEIIPLKIIYLYFKIELWHLCKSLLPSVKGLSFTLCLLLYARVKLIFTFPFLFYPLASTSCWGDPDIYIQLDVS